MEFSLSLGKDDALYGALSYSPGFLPRHQNTDFEDNIRFVYRHQLATPISLVFFGGHDSCASNVRCGQDELKCM